MILVNFGHPLTPENLSELTRILGASVDRVIEEPAQFDALLPFGEQTVALVDGVGLDPVEWQTEPIVVNPPSLNVIVAAVLAELHGRMGYFPPVIRLRPSGQSPTVRFQVAEILDLRAIREAARTRRKSGAKQATGC